MCNPDGEIKQTGVHFATSAGLSSEISLILVFPISKPEEMVGGKRVVQGASLKQTPPLKTSRNFGMGSRHERFFWMKRMESKRDYVEK